MILKLLKFPKMTETSDLSSCIYYAMHIQGQESLISFGLRAMHMKESYGLPLTSQGKFLPISHSIFVTDKQKQIKSKAKTYTWILFKLAMIKILKYLEESSVKEDLY